MGRRIAGCILFLSLALASPGAAAAAGPVGVGHSGWFWGNPQPQGNQLASVDFVGARGFAAGADGTVLRSDDGGATWTGLGAGTQTSLSIVHVIGPNSVVVGGGCSLRRSDDAGNSFTRLPFTPSDSRCQSFVAAVSFSSPTVGYVLLANGTVLRSTDGGRTFGQRTSVPGASSSGQTGSATDIDFVSDTTGTAVAGGRVYRTTNGGDSWTAVSAAGGRVTKVTFVDPASAVAIGDGGTFLASTDGGVTFTSRPLAGEGAGKNLTGVSCSGANTCVMTVSGANQVVRTADGGATSTLVAAADAQVIAADFGAAGQVIGVGGAGLVVVSADSGASFAPVGSRLASTFAGLRSAFGPRAYALGANGRVARTTDGGRNWTAFGVPTGGDIVDVSFPTPAVGYALDDQGALLRTDNAGESWRILDPGVSGDARAVIALDGSRVAVIGPRGVRRSTNGGNSFGASPSRAVRAALTNADRAGGSIVAWGPKAIAVSANGGGRWSKVRAPRGGLRSVDFVSRRRGFAVTVAGRVYTTANGGRRWRQLTAVGGQADSVTFADARRGFVADDEGGLLRTDDGGQTWEPQLVSPQSLTGVVASTPSIAMASAQGGSLFGTAAGGHLARASRLTLKLSSRRLRRAGTVRVRGKLTPASPGSTVTVTLRRGDRYVTSSAVVAATGAFSADFRVTGTSEIIAQWRGDDRLDGDGTAAANVTVNKRRKRGR